MGLGYVGLPLVEAFSKPLNTIGYRRNQKAFDELNATPGSKIGVTTNPLKIKEADFVIIAVPTPVTKAKDSDMEPVESASKTYQAEPEDGRHRGPGVHRLPRCHQRYYGPYP